MTGVHLRARACRRRSKALGAFLGELGEVRSMMWGKADKSLLFVSTPHATHAQFASKTDSSFRLPHPDHACESAPSALSVSLDKRLCLPLQAGSAWATSRWPGRARRGLDARHEAAAHGRQVAPRVVFQAARVTLTRGVQRSESAG